MPTSNKNDTAISEIVYVYAVNYIIFSINYHIEDKKSDLIGSNDDSRYNHFLTIKFLWKSYRFTFKSKHIYDDQPYTD